MYPAKLSVNRIKMSFGIALALTPALLLGACSDSAEVAPEVLDARPVKIIDISAGSTDQSSSYPAVIDSSRKSELSFLVGGLLSELYATEAKEVQQGDVIARLDPRDFQSALDSAQAVYKNAEDEYQRGVRLAAQDAIATSSLEQRESQRDVALSQLETAQKSLQDSVLKAPFSGLVATVPVRESESVTPGTLVATLIDVTTLDATINLPASIIAHVPTQEEPGAMVFLEAASDVGIEAYFSEANLVADATSQTYAVTFSFSAPEGLLVLPGMNATVYLQAGEKAQSEAPPISVPLAAVLSDGSGQYLWIVNEETMTVSRRDISIAPGIGENVIVLSGLVLGDRVVGAGGSYLAEGVEVTAWGQ